jgi:hypothetical protein
VTNTCHWWMRFHQPWVVAPVGESSAWLTDDRARKSSYLGSTMCALILVVS